MSQRQTAIQQEIGRRFGRLSNGTHHGVPVSLVIQFFYLGEFLHGWVAGLRQSAHREKEKQQEENQSTIRGTASSVQCPAALHSDSKPSRESRSIFCCAGSFT